MLEKTKTFNSLFNHKDMNPILKALVDIKYYINLAKEMQRTIFYAHVHACSPNYTDEKQKTLQSIPKQYVFWLVDHSFDRAI